MKFGIFVFGDNHPELGRSNQKYYDEILTMAEWAEELGFDSFWLGEHHLYWYGTCVSPPMLILKAWEQEEFSHKGKYYQYDNATLYVKPVQKPGPPIWLAASSDDTLVKAGELGWPMMGIPFARSNNLLDVQAKNDLYKDNYIRSGHKAEPSIMVALHVYLNENENDAVTLSRPYFDRVTSFTKTHRRPGSKIPNFDELKREGLVVFTTPSQADAIFREYEKTGVTHVICMVNFGGVPMAHVRRTLELMSSEIFPRFQPTS
jgi:alkanesulfonate monooxygenase SsuD/methylene tetrahydromethanopterin reductase-like flavin-dependent oxidoreductase (luciferase family)